MRPGPRFSLWLASLFGAIVALFAIATALLFAGLDAPRHEALATVFEER